MIPANLRWPFLPVHHRFTHFLDLLQPDEACSPVPDIIEQATEKRYFIAFNGTNGNARLNRFTSLIKITRDCGVQLLSHRYAGNTSSCIVFLTGEVEHQAYRLALLPPPESSIPSAPAEVEGCCQMPTY